MMPEGEHPRASTYVYIRQSMSACVITNMLYFQHSKNLPKPDSDILASLYIVTGTRCDCGTLFYSYHDVRAY